MHFAFVKLVLPLFVLTASLSFAEGSWYNDRVLVPTTSSVLPYCELRQTATEFLVSVEGRPVSHIPHTSSQPDTKESRAMLIALKTLREMKAAGICR